MTVTRCAAPAERVEINREGRDERFPFTGTHLCDLTFVKHHPACELDVVVAHVEHTLTRLTNDGEGRR